MAFLLAFILTLAPFLAGGAKAAQRGKVGRAAIYVGAPVSPDGFVVTDSQLEDSVKDVRRALGQSKRFRVVDRPEDATLDLRITARGVSGNGGVMALPLGRGAVAVPLQGYGMVSVLRAGTYEQTFSTQDRHGRSWRLLATFLVKDLEAWVSANRDMLPR